MLLVLMQTNRRAPELNPRARRGLPQPSTEFWANDSVSRSLVSLANVAHSRRSGSERLVLTHTSASTARSRVYLPRRSIVNINSALFDEVLGAAIGIVRTQASAVCRTLACQIPVQLMVLSVLPPDARSAHPNSRSEHNVAVYQTMNTTRSEL